MDTMTKTFHSEHRANDTKEKNADQQQILAENRKNLCMQILENCRNEWYSQYAFLDGAFAALPIKIGEEAGTIGTDGEWLYVSPAFLLPVYAGSPVRIKRTYLHVLFHCLFLHFLPGRNGELVGEEDLRKWNLACDLAVEWILESSLSEQGEKKSDFVGEQEEIRKQCFQILQQMSAKKDRESGEENGRMKKQKSGISAEQIYGWLSKGVIPYEESVLEKCFALDSHLLWKQEWNSKGEGLRKKWEELLQKSMGKQGASRSHGSERGNQREDMDALKKGRYDYRKFLKRFAVMREEVELDMESFDYIPYDLGMRMFGNLPFVEPLEYKEVHKLEELVIAIDTSSSCTKDMVQGFLNETYAILNEKENFFRKFKVVVIQCDCFLQDVVFLHNEEEWKEYIKKVQIQGRSGTDFRPVFEYVEELRRKRELRDLKALIYFTDGDGIYPAKATEYETAFVFLEKNEHMEKVPKWALGLVTDQRGRKRK